MFRLYGDGEVTTNDAFFEEKGDFNSAGSPSGITDITNSAIDNRQVHGRAKYAESVLPNSQGAPRSGAPLAGVSCWFYPARVAQIEQAVERFQRTGRSSFRILGWRFADPRLLGQTPAAYAFWPL